jgi:alpha-1,2-mannosyltransferase
MLAAGAAAFAVSLGLWVYFISGHAGPDWNIPVDLRVYRDGGLIAAHVRPWYDARRASPLYGWPGYLDLKFTYSPFAALTFTLLTVVTLHTLVTLVIIVNILALLAALWFTLGGLGYRRRDFRGGAGQPGTDQPGTGRTTAVKTGAVLLAAAVLLWTEPVQRTLFLGQIELVLMAVIMADMCQPDRRWWKGAGVGIAAGIKLVPLIFIPYLLLTRRFRQAAVAAGTFAATVAIGFVVLPADSRQYWLGGAFARGSRTGFAGFGGNQSLRGIITRLAGSVAGAQPAWLAVAAVTVVLGLACAAALDRAGDRMLALLACALTGLLCSPISWDHHWVWIVPAVAVLAVYGGRARGLARWAYWGVATAIVGLFGAWPVTLWGEPLSRAAFTLGIIWAPPDSNPGYNKLGDRPWFAVYHWHGLELIAGNLYVLTGVALLGLLMAGALAGWRSPHRRDTASTTSPIAAPSSTAGA